MATVKDTNVVQLIKNSGALFAETLHQFRVCHDLLVASGLFSKEEILDMDQCAIVFRDLGLKTTTLANVTSSQWLDTVVLYYENLKDFSASESKQMQGQLTKQAGDLTKAFLVISAWANHLSKQFHKTGTDAIKESEEIEKRFEAALSKANEIQQAAEEQAKKATKAYEDAEAAAKKHHITNFSIHPAASTKLEIGHKVIDHKDPVSEAHKLKEIADEKLQEANQKLKGAKTNEEKAKVRSNCYRSLRVTCPHAWFRICYPPLQLI